MAVRSVPAQSTVLKPASAQRIHVNRDARFGYALLLPTVILILVLVGYPFLDALWLSFHKKILGSKIVPWIGLGNYSSILHDHAFWGAIQNLTFMAGTTQFISYQTTLS